jgi:hypothetical protein
MCIYRTENGKCEKFSDDEHYSYCVDAPCEYEVLSNYDCIRNMSIDDMAELFYGIIHERDLHIMRALEKQGIEASLIETQPEIHIAYHKKWLESARGEHNDR